MKLIHNNFEFQIYFDYCTTNSLIIESPIALRRIITDLKKQIGGESGGFVFSESHLEELSLAQESELILDPFFSSEESRIFSTKLQQTLKQLANNEDFFEKTTQIKSTLLQYATFLIHEIDESLISNSSIDLGSLLKLFNFEIDLTDPDPIENIVTFCKSSSRYLRKRLFFFLNLKSFFDESELMYLVETIHSMKCNILLIENMCRETFIYKEKCYIIDKDLCEIF